MLKLSLESKRSWPRKGSGGESSPGKGNKRYKRTDFRERTSKQHPMKQKSEGKKVPEGAGDVAGKQNLAGQQREGGTSSDFYFKKTTLDFW